MAEQLDDDFYVDEGELLSQFYQVNLTRHEDNKITPVQLSKFSISIAMGVCCGVGLCGNAMSSLIFLSSSMRSPINTLLAAISIIDLILVLLIVPILILPGLDMVLNSGSLKSAYSFAILYIYPLGVMTRSASMWTYVLVGVERYIAICQPLKKYKLLTNRQAKCALCFIVFIAIAYNVVRFWEYRWNGETKQLESHLHENGVYFLFYYTTLHLITHYLLPISIILILHSSIVLNLKHARDGRVPLRCSVSHSGCAAERRQSSTTVMILVATGMFLACNSLAFLVNLWEAIDPRGLENENWSTFVHVMTDLANLLLALHSACSFLIYMKFCRQYRQLFCRICGFAGDKATAKETEEHENRVLLRRGHRSLDVGNEKGAPAKRVRTSRSDGTDCLGITAFRARVSSDLPLSRSNCED